MHRAMRYSALLAHEATAHGALSAVCKAMRTFRSSSARLQVRRRFAQGMG